MTENENPTPAEDETASSYTLSFRKAESKEQGNGAPAEAGDDDGDDTEGDDLG